MIDLGDDNFIRKLNDHLNSGGVIAFPTDTVWGLGAMPNDMGANALYEIKRRPRDKRLIIMSDSIHHIRPHMADFPAAAFELADRFWPGGLTIARAAMGDGCDTWRGGVRVPNHAPFMELCRVIDGHCLATTSANISGMPTLNTADDIRQTFPDVLVIDNAAPPHGGVPSTVVVVSDNGTKTVVRNGAVKID